MTGREIYDRALVLIGEKAAVGDEWQYDTAAFERNAPALINLAAVMTDELDCTVKGLAFGINEHLPYQIKSLDDELGQHPYICMGVIPYALCYLLLLEESPERAQVFYDMFIREMNSLRYRFRPVVRHKVTEVY